MAKSVLVAYATRYGSTKEVADAVAETLRGQGFEVDCQPAREVRHLTGYDAVVLGGALYMFKWHKDARRFLSRHRDALQACPVALFAMGPTEDNEKDWTGAREHLDKALAEFDWLTPVAAKVFGGKFDPAALRFPFSAIPAMKAMPASDLRDWDEIRGWTDEVASKLVQA